MWPYNIVSREQFEEKKDYIQSLIVKLGGKIADIYFPYQQQTTSRFNNYTETYPFNRPVFFFNNLYYRVDEVLFPEKPFIVLEVGDYDGFIKNIMEDAEPFPYDLSDEALENEVKYSLELIPYPECYPE